MALSLVEGWTGTIYYVLAAEDFDFTGCTIEVLAYDKEDEVITLSGTAALVSATTGTVSFAPAANDILASNSPMKIRWKVTDTGGEVFYFPNGAAERWTVFKP